MLLKKPSAVPAFRAKLLFVIFFLSGGLVIFRLFDWQIVRGEQLQYAGLLQQKSSKSQGASRGSILASDGFPMAVSSAGWVVWADPREINDSHVIAEKLAPLTLGKEIEPEEEATVSAQVSEKQKEDYKKERLEAEKRRLTDLLSRKGAWVPLKHKIDINTKQKIQELDITGINFDPEERRTYPEASMAAHILGFVGKDEAGEDKGYFGLEGKYDTALSGVGGEKSWERDALGNPILGGLSRKIEALDGVDLKTHIDRAIQYLAEKHLKSGVEKYGASSGSITIMRSSDGAILAMAALPNYSPANFYQYSKGAFFVNPVISQTFEPGSIFKVLVMAAALDSGAVTPEDRCDQCSGPIKIGQYTIGTWDGKYYPDTTPAEIIKHSDNIGMVWTAQRLGADKLYDYLASFGIGALSGIDLQGETMTSLRKKGKWGDIDLATTSFGQGIAVTPIQMVRAVSAIANKGKLPTPQVVGKVVGKDWEEEVKPQVAKEVISRKTAQQITEMMISAVKKGEAQWAAPKGFLVAGKTGTAQIPIAGHYDPTKTNASFIGFAPADNPQFVMMVTLKEPASSPWAAETAAPLWFNVARDLFVYLGIQPSE